MAGRKCVHDCEGVRKEENILKLEYIKAVVGRDLDDGLGILIGGYMNAHIWELDGCENENGRMMKENMNEIGLQILNCAWDGFMKLHGTQKRRSLHWTMCVWMEEARRKLWVPVYLI